MPEAALQRAPETPIEGDHCPGALRLHAAADGPLARVRVPGGRLTVAQLNSVADLAESLGDGAIHLTARGNLELRAISDAQGLTDALTAAGLLPSVLHERARNVVASPTPALDALVSDLDAAICADPVAAQLSGRFLFGLDDGSGDILALGPDVAGVLRGDDRAALVIGGRPTRFSVATTELGRALAVLAADFVARSDGAWRVRDVDPSVPDAMLEAVRARLATDADVAPLPLDSGHGPAVGVSTPEFGASEFSARLVVGVPLGAAPADAWRQVASAAAAGDGVVRLTPWRRIALDQLSAAAALGQLARLREHGFVVDDTDAAVGLGACTGQPGCAKALADVRADALRSITGDTRGSTDNPTGGFSGAVGESVGGPVGESGGRRLRLPSREHPVFWAGCARACGHPAAAHTRVVATAAGYVIEEHP